MKQKDCKLKTCLCYTEPKAIGRQYSRYSRTWSQNKKEVWGYNDKPAYLYLGLDKLGSFLSTIKPDSQDWALPHLVLYSLSQEMTIMPISKSYKHSASVPLFQEAAWLHLPMTTLLCSTALILPISLLNPPFGNPIFPTSTTVTFSTPPWGKAALYRNKSVLSLIWPWCGSVVFHLPSLELTIAQW